jgi:hypothetical protein
MKGIRIAARHLLVAAVTLINAPVYAAPPAAPAVSVNAGVKQLNFLWNRVEGATRYELWFLPGTGGTWAKYAELPHWRTGLAVNISSHLLIWNEARYQLKACNTSGCGGSPLLAVDHLMQQTVGIFRLPAGSEHRLFGWSTAISEDGGTLAATMDVDESGGVQVFRKRPGGWVHEAELSGDPKLHDIYAWPDQSVAISGNGDVIALGVESEAPPGSDDSTEWRTGAVFVFRRTSSGWVREQKLLNAAVVEREQFGWRVSLDESGTLLAAWRRFGDAPYQPPGPWAHQGHVDLFRYTAGSGAPGTWARVATIPAVNTGCSAMALSGDGNTVVRSCGSTVEVFTAPTWARVASLPNEVYFMSEFSREIRSIALAHDGRSFAVRSTTYDGSEDIARAWVNVYRLGMSGWAREATLAPGAWTMPGPPEDPHAGYGFGVAMSRDGRFLAVGATADAAFGSGVLYPPINGSADSGSGAVYVYEHKPGGWRLRQFIKPNTEVQRTFGWSVDFARNGKDLAVGAEDDGRGSVSLY